jgi:hypothetical protein
VYKCTSKNQRDKELFVLFAKAVGDGLLYNAKTAWHATLFL